MTIEPGLYIDPDSENVPPEYLGIGRPNRGQHSGNRIRM